MLSHQDWNTVKFTSSTKNLKKGKQGIQEAIRRGMQIETIRKQTKNSSHSSLPNIRNLSDENGIIPTTELSHEFRLALQRARVTLNITQASLAKQINEKQSLVNDYETGRAVPNIQIILKMEKVLNCHLPRPQRH